MLHRLKRLIPTSWLSIYHRTLSWVAAFWYGNPSEELIVIGVTGTNGKTTTSYLTARVLEATGEKSGCTTTALFKIGEREWLNDTKMTMLGRFQLQKLLREMVTAGCRYAVVETSSQGIVQHRHRHIHYDVAICTNLTPEHIDAHGSFEAYKQAKIELFRHLARSPQKKIKGVPIPKVAILNPKSEYAKEFAVPGIEKVVRFEFSSTQAVEWGSSFLFEGQEARVHIPGEVNVENAAAALCVATSLGIPREAAIQALDKIKGLPGRFERIEEGQPYSVIVDYAVEPVAMEKLYQTIETRPHGRILHVFGSCGGGRDVARRPILGKMAAEHAQVVIVTNEDPYDDEPRQIMEEIAQGARNAGVSSDALWVIEDRKEAIEKAVQLAQPGDVILLTGKGCEQAIVVGGGKKLPWDERAVAREAIRRYSTKHVET